MAFLLEYPNRDALHSVQSIKNLDKHKKNAWMSLFLLALRHIKRTGKQLVLSAMQQQSELLKIVEIFMNHNSITNTPSNSPRLIFAVQGNEQSRMGDQFPHTNLPYIS